MWLPVADMTPVLVIAPLVVTLTLIVRVPSAVANICERSTGVTVSCRAGRDRGCVHARRERLAQALHVRRGERRRWRCRDREHGMLLLMLVVVIVVLRLKAHEHRLGSLAKGGLGVLRVVWGILAQYPNVLRAVVD